jgi:rhodanese-related sulfurtransferase
MIDQIRPSQLSEWLQQHAGGQPVVLDVREAMELAIARVQPQGFDLVHIPMYEIPERLAELDPQRPVACLCHHGVRSQQVAGFLARKGFEQVVNIAGGIAAWSLERDPSVAQY